MCFGKWEKGTRVFVLAGIRRIFVAILHSNKKMP